jgi:cytoskeletal protein CcmA (bactofilin family)
MGLFGRDDKTTPPSSSAPTAAKNGRTQPETAVTIVAGSSRFDGTLSGSGDVRVEGRIDGRVEVSGHLMVAEGGNVTARSHARVITVAGSVRGDLTADDKIELSPSADVEGTLTAPRILIREGASFEGQVHMRDPGGDSNPSASESSPKKPR